MLDENANANAGGECECEKCERSLSLPLSLFFFLEKSSCLPKRKKNLSPSRSLFFLEKKFFREINDETEKGGCPPKGKKPLPAEEKKKRRHPPGKKGGGGARGRKRLLLFLAGAAAARGTEANANGMDGGGGAVFFIDAPAAVSVHLPHPGGARPGRRTEMSEHQNRQRRQVKQARLEVAATLYRRGYSIRKIREEAMARLGLASYSLQTVHRDVRSLLAEWRESRLGDMDAAVQLELERIGEAVRECWGQWEASKQGGARPGDVSYITEIGRQLVERRKLLGLYAPERREVRVREYDLGDLTAEQREALLRIGERVLDGTEKGH